MSQINIGSGNGLVPSGNKPLPEPMLTQDLCHHMASLGHNVLSYLHQNNVKQWQNIQNDLFFFETIQFVKVTGLTTTDS